jgi:prefoldin subunit 5
MFDFGWRNRAIDAAENVLVGMSNRYNVGVEAKINANFKYLQKQIDELEKSLKRLKKKSGGYKYG